MRSWTLGILGMSAGIVLAGSAVGWGRGGGREGGAPDLAAIAVRQAHYARAERELAAVDTSSWTAERRDARAGVLAALRGEPVDAPVILKATRVVQADWLRAPTAMAVGVHRTRET
jgi:hypothetical protein